MLDGDWLEVGVTNGDQGEKIRLELLLLRCRESCFVAPMSQFRGNKRKNETTCLHSEQLHTGSGYLCQPTDFGRYLSSK